MNEWPDELWVREVEAYANDAEDWPTEFTTASSDLKEAVGLLTTALLCAGLGLLAATVGWSIIQIWLNQRDSTFGRGATRG